MFVGVFSMQVIHEGRKPVTREKEFHAGLYQIILSNKKAQTKIIGIILENNSLDLDAQKGMHHNIMIMIISLRLDAQKDS